MTDNILKLLNPGIGAKLDTEFRAGRATSLDVTDYVQPFPRSVDLRPLDVVLDEAMKRFDRKDAPGSDGWLAPRLHHVLRLHRNEAAQRELWTYLAVGARPDYVAWRFGSEDDTAEPPGTDRFNGPDYKHAFGRLWWVAELFRDGPDYTPVVKAFSYQDIPNNLFRMDIAHHRPTLQGAIRTLFPGGKPIPRLADSSNALARAANAAITTLQLDMLAPDPFLDEAATKEWIDGAGDVDAVAACGDLPEGPQDPKVPEESVAKMAELLTTLLAEAILRVRGSKDDEEEERADAEDAESSDEGSEDADA